MNLVDELHAVASALTGAGIRYAVCGGIAVTIHGATRTTKDIDLLVAPADVPQIVELLRTLGYVFAALPMTFDEGSPRQRRVQRVSKMDAGQHLIVDLLLAEASLAGFLDGSIEIDLPAGPLTVVSLDALKQMKRLADREQDRADLLRLEDVDG